MKRAAGIFLTRRPCLAHNKKHIETPKEVLIVIKNLQICCTLQYYCHFFVAETKK